MTRSNLLAGQTLLERNCLRAVSLSISEKLTSDEAPCPLCGAHMLISAINGHIDRGCPPPKPKASTSASGNQKADWKKVFSGAGSSKGKE